MQFVSYALSVCLHCLIFFIIWFWPASRPVKLESPPVMISLVDGTPGGNRTPSPIMGQVGEPQDENILAPTPPAPKSEIAAPEREEIREPKLVPTQNITPTPVQQKPELKPEPKVETKPEPKPEAKPILAPKVAKKEEPKKEEKKSEKKEPVKKTPPPKPAEEKKTEKTKTPPKPEKKDPVAAALQQARRKASSRAESGDKGNAVEQALAQAKRNAGGNRGGGGGEGGGRGGGGLGNVYLGQVMLAVRPNWGYASANRKNLSCTVKVQIDMKGKVLHSSVSKSSGNQQFDASALNAIARTDQAGNFPPPPSREYTDLDLVFTLDELMGR